MEKEVLKTVKKYNLIEPDDIIIVGLSGGADSVSLLLCLNSLKSQLKIKKIIACHLNHSLRDTALRDELFSKELCKKLDIEFYSETVDISKLKSELKCCEEEAGRIARYRFFHRIKAETCANKIATAHNKGDQVETFFIRLLRGSSVDGLTSIKPIREDGVIRPIIEIDREKILDYLGEKSQTYVTDETNNETDYLRNKIRLKLIPYLKENFNFNSEVITDSIELFKKDSEFFSKITHNLMEKSEISDNKITYNLEDLTVLDEAVLSRVVLRSLKDIFNISTGRDNISEIIKIIRKGRTGKKVRISDNVVAFTDYDKFIIKKEDIINKYSYKIKLGDNYIKEVNLVFTLMPGTGKGKDCINLGSADGIEVRTRREGDKIYIRNTGHKKIKNIFIDNKISREKREVYPIVTQGGEAVWLPGLYKNEGDNGKFKLTVRRMV